MRLLFLFYLLCLASTYELCSNSASTSCLPCPNQCNSCSTQSLCSTCATEYYYTASSGSQCSNCPSNCQTCISSTSCSKCMDPYVLSNQTCNLCVIQNALKCSSTVAASSCQSGYYLSNSYCQSCLLNCATCSSAYDCSKCATGYYLNTSIITCNPCPLGCSTCNQYTPTQCTSCNDGYLFSSSSCSLNTCLIDNCVYCSNQNVCGKCKYLYYWNGSNCTMGASVTCEMGALGPLPNSCSNSCSGFSYQDSSNSSMFSCKLFRSIYNSPVEYYQIYLYSYSHLDKLNSYQGTTQSLSLASNGEYSFPFTGKIDFGSVPNYYRVRVSLKYTSSDSLSLVITASTPIVGATQKQTHVVSQSSTPAGVSLNSTVVHSNNIAISTNVSIGLIEIMLRFWKCSAGCTVCLNQQLCQLCDDPNFMLSYNCVANCTVYIHFMPNRTCLTSCPSGYFQTVSVDNLKYCTSCNSPCLACSNSSFCISCISGYYYYNYNCNTVCPSGYYANSSSNTCKSCINPCKTCSSETTCLSCSQGFWNGTACSNSCPNGQFGDSINFVCSSCDPSCLTCINSATTCTSCNSSLIFYNKQCLPVCPTRFFNQSGTCSLCIPPCYTCSSQVLCLSCSYNYLLNSTCISQCPLGFYKNQTNLICASCLPACYTCSSSSMCTSCKSGCLYSGTCLTNCPSLQLYQKISSSSLCDCVQCVYPCNTCTNQNTCLSCLQGYFFNGSCLISCPGGYYSNNQNDTCETCNSLFSNCLSCSSSGCSQCSNTYLLLNGLCFSSCPQSYYAQNQQCSLCIAPCKTCSSSDICKSCITPYSLSQQTCLIQCPSTMISIAVNGSLVCFSCTSPCLSCSIKQNNCTYCVFGYYLINNTCVINCSQISPLNSYYSELSSLTCQKCTFPCQLCQTQTWCLSCKIGYLNPLTGTCSQCLLGTYSYNFTCVSCPSSCSICYSQSFCTACVNGYYLFNNTCTSNSSICLNNGYYTSGRVCYPCLQPCSRCWISSNNCTSCLQGYIFFSPNRCLINCPNGFYQSGYQCLLCSSQCETCISMPNYCLTCNTGYYLYTQNYSCVLNCPPKTYLAGTSCSACQYPCENCLSQMVCLSCTSGVLVGGQCYSSCLSGYFANPSLVCQACTLPCSECFEKSTNCTQCTLNYWMLNNQCVSSCPSHYFSESQSRQCLKCTGLCDECNSYINCTKCITSFIYFFSVKNQLGQCLTACPATYYLQNNSCQACGSDCNTCQDSSGCQTCKGQLVQSNGKCLAKCPDLMYSYGGICYSCQFPCSNCTDAYTCTSCPSDYLLVGSSSCVPGPTCPSGYYLQQSLIACNSKCSSGYYNLLNNTCNNISCGKQAFIGADMFCYLSCPSGYTANRSLYCVPCTSCEDGLYFSVSSSIIRDQLYVYISFTEQPEYAFNPQLKIVPNLPYKTTNSDGIFVAGVLNKTGSKNITLLITVKQSIAKSSVNFSFSNPIQTFANPLQKSYQILQFQGYDYYPQDLSSLSALGIISLVSALIGLFKNPFLTDFAQILFLIGLLNTHYPYNLASFLESCSIAHLHGIIPLQQQDNLGKGKFMYLTGVGFLSNTITNWLIIAAILGFSAILFFVLWIGRKNLHYSRVHQQNFQQSLTEEKKEPSFSQKCLQKIDALLSSYKIRWLNRLLYFNYSIISLFSFVQISQFNTSNTLNMLSSAMAALVLPLLLIFPISLRTQKTKYTFLYLRKLLISAAVVLSVEDSIYAIGIISVCNIAAILLLLTYKMQKYRAQTRFLAIGQSLQLFTLICLSLFIMIGEGNKTNYKVMLSWVIVIGFIITLTYYVAWACFQIFIAVYNSKKNIQFRENWILNRLQQEIQSHHSESVSQSMKDNNQNPINPANNVETVLLKQVQQDKQQPFNINSHPVPNKSAQKSRPNTKGNGDFWAYQQSQSSNGEKQQQKEIPKPQLPQMLIRCINEFSDYNKSEVHE